MPINTKTFVVSPFRHQRNIAFPGQPENLALYRRINLRFYWIGDWTQNNVYEAFDTCEREAKRLLALALIGATSSLSYNRNGMYVLIEMSAQEKDVAAHCDVLKSNGFKEGK